MLSQILTISTYNLSLIVWAALVIISIIIEVSTEDLVIVWATVGSIIAFVAALLNADIWVQLLLFIVFTTISIIVTRPLAKKLAKKEVIRTNADRVIGMVATVIEPFSNNSIGKVSINGHAWRATSLSNESFFEGEKVQVDGLSGTKVVISKIINNENIVRL